MKATLLQNVPLGRPVQEARKFMEHEGFTCTLRKNETFYERCAWYDSGPKHDGIDFLECRRVQDDGSFLMSRFWNVALVLKDERVSDILVANWVDGP
jgi:hypothetical protein